MVLTREAIEQNTHYEHGSLYYTDVRTHPASSPCIIPAKMKEIGYTFTGMVLCVYDEFDRIYQRWFEVKRGRSKRYILA